MEHPYLSFSRKDPDTLLISLAGDWKKEKRSPDVREIKK
jgi:hypothetical protein